MGVCRDVMEVTRRQDRYLIVNKQGQFDTVVHRLECSSMKQLRVSDISSSA